MVLHEPFRGQLIYKFPGGGLEFGEGTRECLEREFMEELNLKVQVKEHIYTQDFFIQNVFDPSEQIVLIYYTAEVDENELAQLQIMDTAIKEVCWIELNELDADQFSLEADKVAINYYKAMQAL